MRVLPHFSLLLFQMTLSSTPLPMIAVMMTMLCFFILWAFYVLLVRLKENVLFMVVSMKERRDFSLSLQTHTHTLAVFLASCCSLLDFFSFDGYNWANLRKRYFHRKLCMQWSIHSPFSAACRVVLWGGKSWFNLLKTHIMQPIDLIILPIDPPLSLCLWIVLSKWLPCYKKFSRSPYHIFRIFSLQLSNFQVHFSWNTCKVVLYLTWIKQIIFTSWEPFFWLLKINMIIFNEWEMSLVNKELISSLLHFKDGSTYNHKFFSILISTF